MNPFLSFPSTIKRAATTATVEKGDDDIGELEVGRSGKPIIGNPEILALYLTNRSQPMSI